MASNYMPRLSYRYKALNIASQLKVYRSFVGFVLEIVRWNLHNFIPHLHSIIGQAKTVKHK